MEDYPECDAFTCEGLDHFNCDKKPCQDCRIAHQERKVGIIKFKKMQKKIALFDQILATQRYFEVKAKMFGFRHYIRNGYQLGEDYTVLFIYDDCFRGSLLDHENHRIQIHHNGELKDPEDKFNDKPSFCDYFFEKRMLDDETKDTLGEIKIILKDVIFEDYVHKGYGLIISDSELKKALKLVDIDLETELACLEKKERKLLAIVNTKIAKIRNKNIASEEKVS